MVSATYNDSVLSINDGEHTIRLNIDSDLREINTMLESGTTTSSTYNNTKLLNNYKKAQEILTATNKKDPKIDEIIEKLSNLVNG